MSVGDLAAGIRTMPRPTQVDEATPRASPNSPRLSRISHSTVGISESIATTMPMGPRFGETSMVTPVMIPTIPGIQPNTRCRIITAEKMRVLIAPST